MKVSREEPQKTSTEEPQNSYVLYTYAFMAGLQAPAKKQKPEKTAKNRGPSQSQWPYKFAWVSAVVRLLVVAFLLAFCARTH